MGASYTDPPEPSGEPPTARQEWLLPPTVPSGTTVRLMSVIKSGRLTPEVFELLGRLARETQQSVLAADQEFAPGSCPHLVICGTKTGSCPELLSCTHFTALAEVETIEADTSADG